MKINFNQSIKQLGKDEPLLKPNSKEAFCLKDAAIDSLLAPTPPGERQSGEEKAKHYLMAMRIYTNPEDVDFTVEEISKIKQVIGNGYAPLVVGQAWEMLEGIK
jgi:hypothetical protein